MSTHAGLCERLVVLCATARAGLGSKQAAPPCTTHMHDAMQALLLLHCCCCTVAAALLLLSSGPGFLHIFAGTCFMDTRETTASRTKTTNTMTSSCRLQCCVVWAAH